MDGDFTEEGGNATELDVVLRSHFVKHWKNGKFDVVTTEMTTEIIKLEIWLAKVFFSVEFP